jgi:hypothetical protein
MMIGIVEHCRGAREASTMQAWCGSSKRRGTPNPALAGADYPSRVRRPARQCAFWFVPTEERDHGPILSSALEIHR